MSANFANTVTNENLFSLNRAESAQTTDTTDTCTAKPCGSKIQHVVGSVNSRYAINGRLALASLAAAQTDRQTDRQTDNYIRFNKSCQ